MKKKDRHLRWGHRAFERSNEEPYKDTAGKGKKQNAIQIVVMRIRRNLLKTYTV